MNIVQAFIKFNGVLIIVVSGLSGSGKTEIATRIENDLQIKKINIENYCIPTNDKIVTLSDGTQIVDWDHIDSYDWQKINSEIEKNKDNGVVVCGPYFPVGKLKSEPNFHIQVKMSKQTLVEKRHEYIKANPVKCKDLVPFLDTPTELLIINQITYPHYLEYVEKSKIDLFVNPKDMTIDQMYDKVFDFIMFKIDQFLKERNEKRKNMIEKKIEENKPDKYEKAKLKYEERKNRTIDESSTDTEDLDPNEPLYIGTTYS